MNLRARELVREFSHMIEEGACQVLAFERFHYNKVANEKMALWLTAVGQLVREQPTRYPMPFGHHDPTRTVIVGATVGEFPGHFPPCVGGNVSQHLADQREGQHGLLGSQMANVDLGFHSHAPIPMILIWSLICRND